MPHIHDHDNVDVGAAETTAPDTRRVRQNFWFSSDYGSTDAAQLDHNMVLFGDFTDVITACATLMARDEGEDILTKRVVISFYVDKPLTSMNLVFKIDDEAEHHFAVKMPMYMFDVKMCQEWGRRTVRALQHFDKEMWIFAVDESRTRTLRNTAVYECRRTNKVSKDEDRIVVYQCLMQVLGHWANQDSTQESQAK